MQSNLEFVTDGSVKYHLAGNDWYAVMRDDDKVMLVDTDCKVYDEELWTPWSSGNWRNESGENGQAVLDRCNNLVNKYFSDIKHAIMPRVVEAGTGKLENAYMRPMSKEEFGDHKVISGNIVKNSNSHIWTRSFASIYSGSDRYAWYVNGASGDLYSGGNVSNLFRVAPAFNLKKSAIDHINDDGEIIIKSADTHITD